MAVKQAPPPSSYHDVSVHGLEHGRKQARRRAARRRAKNTVISGMVLAVIAVAAGGAGYYLLQFYGDEQNRVDPATPQVQRDAEQLIDELEDRPRWNGPGAPAFGVGDEPQP